MPSRAKLTIDAGQPGPVISRHLFGHFSEHLGRCIYDGLWVGEDSPIPHLRGIRRDLVAALRQIRIPNLRWPGGCFADDYHWRDGLGPRDRRPRRFNAWWGGVVENNAFGTHEFLDLCAQLGCEPYFAGNLGSGTVREMRDWVEYLNAPPGSTLSDERAAHGRREPARVRYWGVGNENWGCGGNMRPEHYADEYRRYAGYLRDYPDAPLFRVACGPNGDNYAWTEVLMRECAAAMQGLSLHYYVVPGGWDHKRPASPFTAAEWDETLALAWRMDALVRGHRAVMDRFDSAAKVALVVDEWGTWFAPEPGTNPGFLYQQQTVRDAVVAALTLDVFIAHCERVRLANLAQTVNVLQAVALTDGGRLVLTPTWDVFALYAAHHDARRLPVAVAAEVRRHAGAEFPGVSASASLAADGAVNVTLCHTDPENAVELELDLAGQATDGVTAQLLSAPALTACNTFDQPRAVTTRPLPGLRAAGGSVRATLPPGSVAAFRFSR